jgi:uncharacterized protein YacL
MDVSYGFLSVLPLILMIVLAVITKKVLEPVILCTLLAFIISDKTNFFFAWASALESEVSNFAYFTLVFASIGALIRLLMKSFQAAIEIHQKQALCADGHMARGHPCLCR